MKNFKIFSKHLELSELIQFLVYLSNNLNELKQTNELNIVPYS